MKLQDQVTGSGYLKAISEQINENAVKKGFWETIPTQTTEKLMLIVSEISEAMEADRKDRYCTCNIDGVNGWLLDSDFVPHFEKDVKDTFQDEMADAIIRILDLCHHKGINIEGHIKAKMRYNTTRDYLHKKKY